MTKGETTGGGQKGAVRLIGRRLSKLSAPTLENRFESSVTVRTRESAHELEPLAVCYCSPVRLSDERVSLVAMAAFPQMFVGLIS